MDIIALTGNAFSSDERRCMEAGMDAYLSKPIGKDRLASAPDAAAAGRPDQG